MKHLRLSCEGVLIGSIWIPPFQLNTGEAACLHMPCLAWSREESEIVQALTGERPVPGLRLLGRVRWADPPRSTTGWRRWFSQSKAATWLRRAAPITHAQSLATVARLGLRPEWRISQLSGNLQLLLALEAAWAQGAEVVVFSTVGCIHEPIHDAVAARLAECAVIKLSYEYTQNGRKQRDCFPHSLHVELREQAPTSASLTPAGG
jgi:hypothetical protein